MSYTLRERSEEEIMYAWKKTAQLLGSSERSGKEHITEALFKYNLMVFNSKYTVNIHFLPKNKKYGFSKAYFQSVFFMWLQCKQSGASVFKNKGICHKVYYLYIMFPFVIRLQKRP